MLTVDAYDASSYHAPPTVAWDMLGMAASVQRCLSPTHGKDAECYLSIINDMWGKR